MRLLIAIIILLGFGAFAHYSVSGEVSSLVSGVALILSAASLR